MSDNATLVAIVACIWIGWPLHQIAGRLKFLCDQVRARQ